MKKTHKANDLIGTGEAAKLLNVKPRTFRSWVNAGACKFGKVDHLRVGKNDMVSRRAMLRLKVRMESESK